MREAVLDPESSSIIARNSQPPGCCSPPDSLFMNTLLWFVILYWVISVGIGLWATHATQAKEEA